MGGPGGAEAVGDLAEDDAGPERLFGAVVGCGDRPVGKEDEQVVSIFLDDALQLEALAAGRREPEQAVNVGLQLGRVCAQRGVGELVAALSVGAGSAQQFVQGRREDAVACIDGILGVAQQVRVMPTSA